MVEAATPAVSRSERWMRRLVLVAVSFGLISVAWDIYSWRWYSAWVPEEIGLRWYIEHGVCYGIRESDVAAVFKFDDETGARIEREGLSFFASARKPRGDVFARPGVPIQFEVWRRAETKEDFHQDGPPPELACAGINEAMHKEIYMALNAPGWYFTKEDDWRLIVLPKLKLVLLGCWGC